MTKEFKDLQKELLEKAKEKQACASEYKRALSATNEVELLKVIYDNLGWCSENKIVDNTYLGKFNAANLLASGCANTGLENTGLANSGNSNSGDSNSGYRNSGNRNSGDSNSGYRNSGNRNSGYRNSGNRNSGDRNSGNSNSGDSNSGYRNSGNRNSGNRNSGNWNSGNRNSGDSNSGYRNSGAFCTDTNPTLFLFDKPSKMTIKEWENSKAYNLMYSVDPTVWISWNSMSDEEKKANPKLELSEGYAKSIPLKDAWKNAWSNWSEESRKEFTSLENFDAKIFEEITGINVLSSSN